MTKGPKRQPKAKAQKTKAWIERRPEPKDHTVICHARIACDGAVVPWDDTKYCHPDLCHDCLTVLWAEFWWTFGIPAVEAPHA